MKQVIPPIATLVAGTALLGALFTSVGDRRVRSVTIAAPEVPSSMKSPHGTRPAPGTDNVSADFGRQLESLKLRLEATPEDTAVLKQMARLYDDAHQPAAAIPYYERYLTLDPVDRQVWLDLAGAYGALGRWEDALEATRAILRMNSDDVLAMYNLGAIHANMGAYAEARAWWEKVREHSDASLAETATASLERLSHEMR